MIWTGFYSNGCHCNYHGRQINARPSYILTHWGRVTHICVSKLTIIASNNGLSPDRRQAIIWTNAGLLLIGPLGANFSEILIEILTFSFKKMRLKVSSAKRRPFCPGLNVLICLMVVTVATVATKSMPGHHAIGLPLTHWGPDKMDAISQTTFSNAFSWMKMHEFRLIFHWSLFPRLELTIFQHWFR